MKTGATFSADNKYRYRLWRIWDESLPLIMFIGLNPSKANGDTNDNTITKIIKIAKNNGYGGLYMMNLFAIISSDPTILETCENPIADNDSHLGAVGNLVKDVAFCWGVFKQIRGRDQFAKRIFKNALCLKHTKNGSPWHPLYCKDDTTLIPFDRIQIHCPLTPS